MSLESIEDFRFPQNQQKVNIEVMETKLRKQLHHFEFSPLKSRDKIFKFQTSVLLPSLKEMKDYEKKIKGFNTQAFFIGIILFHTGTIYWKQIMLNEMGKERALRHMSIALAIGFSSGIFFGFTLAKSFGLYRDYKLALKRLENLNANFEYYYVSRNEEEFEE